MHEGIESLREEGLDVKVCRRALSILHAATCFFRKARVNKSQQIARARSALARIAHSPYQLETAWEAGLSVVVQPEQCRVT